MEIVIIVAGAIAVIAGCIILACTRKSAGMESTLRFGALLACIFGLGAIAICGLGLYNEWQDGTPEGQLVIAQERAANDAAMAIHARMDNVRYVSVDRSLQAGLITIGLPGRANARATANIVKTAAGWRAGCKDAVGRFVPFEGNLVLWQVFVQGGQCPPGYIAPSKP